MSRIVTTGKRYLEDGVWHDDNGPIPDTPPDWDPPMTDAEISAAALSDPDAQPLTNEQLAGMRRVPLARSIRWRLGLSQSEFAQRFKIPVGTLRDWEQFRTEPDAAATAYLQVIAGAPDTVRKVLENEPA